MVAAENATMESSLQKQTRFIEDLRGKHQGEEIWVLGCGPSLDDFPDDFFNDKIAIAVNGAIIAFPECTYWHGFHKQFRTYLRDEKPEFLQKSIILFPLPNERVAGCFTEPAAFFGDLTSQIILMEPWPEIVRNNQITVDAVEDIMAGRHCAYPTMYSSVHTAIQAAAIMGAKQITLVGCEHSQWWFHAQTRGMTRFYEPDRYKQLLRPRNQGRGTRLLAESFGKHRVEVVRHFHKDITIGLGLRGEEHFKQGYQPIV